MNIKEKIRAEIERLRKETNDSQFDIGQRCGYNKVVAFIDSLPDEPEWKPLPESMEALMYATEGRWDMIKPTSYLSRRLEDLYDELVNTYQIDEDYVSKNRGPEK